jgi:hypothetical protein
MPVGPCTERQTHRVVGRKRRTGRAVYDDPAELRFHEVDGEVLCQPVRAGEGGVGSAPRAPV